MAIIFGNVLSEPHQTTMIAIISDPYRVSDIYSCSSLIFFYWCLLLAQKSQVSESVLGRKNGIRTFHNSFKHLQTERNVKGRLHLLGP